MALGIADRWFDRRTMDDGVTLLWEPHVVPLMQCNIWHVRGSERDMIVDTGMGVASLVDAAQDLLDRSVTAVATHGHGDHIGSHHEFDGSRDAGDEVLIHPAEARDLEHPTLDSLDANDAWGEAGMNSLRDAGYSVDFRYFVTALPAGMALEGFRQKPAKISRLIDEGDVIDLGDRQFEVLHLPGHSPGSVGLWESATGTLFSGDAIYDGPLLDEFSDSDIGQYCTTMERLLELPVNVVHGGHDPSFGRDRLRELATAYLHRRRGS
jgi:glyoxylase-like metal-dependent hydrolase (beta-lactamase superfamily II)